MGIAVGQAVMCTIDKLFSCRPSDVLKGCRCGRGCISTVVGAEIMLLEIMKGIVQDYMAVGAAKTERIDRNSSQPSARPRNAFFCDLNMND
jgi:hypothetical protein